MWKKGATIPLFHLKRKQRLNEKKIEKELLLYTNIDFKCLIINI